MCLILAFFLLVAPFVETGYINDYAGTLTPSQKSLLEKQLTSLSTNEGIVFVVVTVPDLQGKTIEALSQEIFASWQIGHDKRDSGILLLVSPKEAFIDLGYGLEANITTKQAEEICQKQILPLLKSGKMQQAVVNGVTAVFSTMGVFIGPGDTVSSPSIYTSYPVLFFVLSIPLLYLLAYFAPTRLFFLSPLLGFIVGITQSFTLALVLAAFGVVMVLICALLKWWQNSHRY